MAKIDIEIKPDGTIKAVVREEKGKACTKYIPVIEEMLGAKIEELEYTDEYNMDIKIKRENKIESGIEMEKSIETEEIVISNQVITG